MRYFNRLAALLIASPNIILLRERERATATAEMASAKEKQLTNEYGPGIVLITVFTKGECQ